MAKERRGDWGAWLEGPPELSAPRPTGWARSGQVTGGEEDLVSQKERGWDGGIWLAGGRGTATGGQGTELSRNIGLRHPRARCPQAPAGPDILAISLGTLGSPRSPRALLLCLTVSGLFSAAAGSWGSTPDTI